MLLNLIACSLASAACSARYRASRAPWWTAFTAWNAVRAALFVLIPSTWGQGWVATEVVTLLLQALVTLEALLLMAQSVKRFSWKWVFLGAIILPAIIAAMLGAQHVSDPRAGVRSAIWWNQITGIGLGVIVALAAATGMLIRSICSPRSLFHAMVVSLIWMLSGVGYRAYGDLYGKLLAEWSPVVLMMWWATCISDYSEKVPALNRDSLLIQIQKLKRSKRIASN